MKLEYLKCISENIDLDEYIEFREYVKANMLNPDWLGDFSREDLINMLNQGAKIWIYYNDTDLVCSMMFIPSGRESLESFDLNSLNYLDVADYGPIFVNPKYVGNGLQYQMLEILDSYANNKGYKYALVTIHPENTYSINNFLKDEFEYQNTKNFKRGVRNIYMKKL